MNLFGTQGFSARRDGRYTNLYYKNDKIKILKPMSIGNAKTQGIIKY
jgi:hypothetical protein